MLERNLTVIGSYSTREEALSVIEQLHSEGYSRDDIIIYTTKDAATNFGFDGLSGIDVETGVNGVETTHEDRSIWEKIKDAFSADTYEYDSSLNEEADYANNDPLYQYRDDISAGKIIITVNNYKNDSTQATENVTGRHATGATRTNNVHASDAARATGLDTDSIQLKEEQLDITTHDVTTGKVDIHKNVVNETKTVEVPVKREEIVIERKPVVGAAATTDVNDTLEDDTITIPIKEEQIEVNKRPVVREEVDIRKQEHEDMKQVSENVSHEELDIDTSGDVHVEDLRDNDRNKHDRI
ncbi:DUF2382 domain-containing protein [Weissella confusa]|uniref:DUF2382 domain-containing protein n=1 Tax=Weissella confusa TaxID=1583 RepID=UPI00223B0CE8|nr:DUF2382 domain-containing protein [Weissella confusa]MCT0949429.1 DUF2382 domain-containing protein [Weissella confusa]